MSGRGMVRRVGIWARVKIMFERERVAQAANIASARKAGQLPALAPSFGSSKHRFARMVAFAGRQERKALTLKSRRAMRKASQRRNRSNG